MKSQTRGVIGVKLSPWLGYSFSGGGVYFFKVRICKYIEVANYPLIQVGVTYLDLAELVSFTMAEVLTAVPLVISSGSNIPYDHLGGTWVCPEHIKLDKASAPVIINPNDYVALSVFPWTIPTFFEADLEYIPIGNDYSEIPESIPNMWKEEIPGNGAVFSGNKGQDSNQNYSFAIRNSYYNYTTFTWWGQMLYEGCDLDEDHILLNYDTNYPTATDPNSIVTGSYDILSCHSNYGGYPISYQSYTYSYHALANRYTGWYDTEYYPPRNPIPGGGFPGIILFPSPSLFDMFNIQFPGDKRRRPKF